MANPYKKPLLVSLPTETFTLQDTPSFPRRDNDYCNGHYDRNLLTRHSPIEDTKVPRIDHGVVEFIVFDRYERRRRDVDSAIGRLFVNEISTRNLKGIEELDRACGNFLLACRMVSVSEIKREVLTKRGRYTNFKDNLQANEVIVGNHERRRRYIPCYDQKEASRQQGHCASVARYLNRRVGAPFKSFSQRLMGD